MSKCLKNRCVSSALKNITISQTGGFWISPNYSLSKSLRLYNRSIGSVSMSQFKHTALEPPSKQIRLIQLLPRHYDDKGFLEDAEASKFAYGAFTKEHGMDPTLKCTMRHVMIDDEHEPKPTYMALSYTWGAPDRSHRIKVNDSYFQVTESLSCALQHIQSNTETLTLWIDQLCINQEDVGEKKAQIPLMKDIYGNAVQTIVWLGPATDDSDLIMEFLADVGKEAYEFGLMEITLAQFQNWDESQGNEQLQNIKNHMDALLERVGSTFPVEAFGNLIARSWFSRVWVVQEVSLGKDVVFECGRKKISYEHLRAATFFHVFYTWNMTRDLELFKSYEDLAKKANLLTTLNSIDTAPVVSMLRARRKYQARAGNEGEPLYSLLKGHKVGSTEAIRLEATDPRDIIYGFFGLASDFVELGIQADYERSFIDLYTNVARSFIKQGHVDLLALSQHPETPNPVDGVLLPSWVPDWAGTIMTPFGEVSEFGKPFSASGTSAVAVIETEPFNTTLNILGLQGVRVDQVELVGTVLPANSGPFPASELYIFLSEIDKFCQESARRHTGIYAQPERQMEAVWRVPIGDREYSTGGFSFTCRATAESRHGHEIAYRTMTMIERVNEQEEIVAQMIKQQMGESQSTQNLATPNVPAAVSLNENPAPSLAPLGDMDNPDAMSYISMTFFMRNRRPFMSMKGYVGLGPAHMQPGDIICILCGATTPYVLRSYEDRRFMLVGEAYCDGIMDGEFMEENPEKETFFIA